MAKETMAEWFERAKVDGDAIEDLFDQVLSAKGYNVVRASRHDDFFKHIDLYVNGIGIDVKSRRRLDQIWLEMVNNNGNKGWLQGEAEYIAFHFAKYNHFKVFRREDLRKFVEENVTETSKNSKEYLKYYTREHWGKKDKLVKVKYNHIKHLYHFIVKC